MKRLFVLITVIAFALTVNAQIGNAASTSIGKNSSNVTLAGATSDTLSTNQSWNHTFNMAAKNVRYGYHLQVKLDSISGTPNPTIYLVGTQDNGSTLVYIDTINWYGSTSDTTFYYNDVSTGVLFRKLILRGSASTGVAQVDGIYGKIGGL